MTPNHSNFNRLSREERRAELKKIAAIGLGNWEPDLKVLKHLAEDDGIFDDIKERIEADFSHPSTSTRTSMTSWVTRITENEYLLLGSLHKAELNGLSGMSGSELREVFNQGRKWWKFPLPGVLFYVLMETLEEFGYVARFDKDQNVFGRPIKQPWFAITGAGRHELSMTDSLLEEARAQHTPVVWPSRTLPT